MIQHHDFFYVHASGQRKTGLERLDSSTSPGTMVHVLLMFLQFLGI